MLTTDNEWGTAYIFGTVHTEQAIDHYFPQVASGMWTYSSVRRDLALRKKAASSDMVQQSAAQSQMVQPAEATQGQQVINNLLITVKVQQLETAHRCEPS